MRRVDSRAQGGLHSMPAIQTPLPKSTVWVPLQHPQPLGREDARFIWVAISAG
jgi:hypothetical protein